MSFEIARLVETVLKDCRENATLLPPATKASSKEANLINKKNPHIFTVSNTWTEFDKITLSNFTSHFISQ